MEVYNDMERGKMAKGGVTEHGLKRGDTIIDDLFWSNEAVVRDSKGVSHKVDIDKGKRYAKGGKTKQDPPIVRGYFEDEAIDYAKGGKINFKFKVGDIIKVPQYTGGKLKKLSAEIVRTYSAKQNDGTYYPFYYVVGKWDNAKEMLYDEEKILEYDNKTTKFADGGTMGKGIVQVKDYYITPNLDGGYGSFKSKKEGGVPFYVTTKEGVIVYKAESMADAKEFINDRYEYGGSMAGWCYSIGGL
jgi:hypothetical protein